ncbi:MAG: YraN family protein [Lewinellaceae bacterium]|nr:YraN family protein [Lewinellaceae bacterium]
MPQNKRSNNSIGEFGEDIAAAYLTRKGYRVVARNYRAGRGEIDIIAWQGEQLLVFVEVKTRSGENYGGPEQAITRRKQQLIMRTAGAYMASIGYEWAIRFDSVAIILYRQKVLDLRHHEDAFFF